MGARKLYGGLRDHFERQARKTRRGLSSTMVLTLPDAVTAAAEWLESEETARLLANLRAEDSRRRARLTLHDNPADPREVAEARRYLLRLAKTLR